MTSEKACFGYETTKIILEELHKLQTYLWAAPIAATSLLCKFRECIQSDEEPNEQILGELQTLVNTLYTMKESVQEAEQEINIMLEKFGWFIDYQEDLNQYEILAPELEQR